MTEYISPDVGKTRKDSKGLGECPICYEECLDLILSCNHAFHKACLERHFKPECPLCRTSFTEIEVKGSRPSAALLLEPDDDTFNLEDRLECERESMAQYDRDFLQQMYLSRRLSTQDRKAIRAAERRLNGRRASYF